MRKWWNLQKYTIVAKNNIQDGWALFPKFYANVVYLQWIDCIIITRRRNGATRATSTGIINYSQLAGPSCPVFVQVYLLMIIAVCPCAQVGVFWVIFHTFTKDGELRRKWLIAIRHDEGPFFRVMCSAVVWRSHFTASDFSTGRRQGFSEKGANERIAKMQWCCAVSFSKHQSSTLAIAKSQRNYLELLEAVVIMNLFRPPAVWGMPWQNPMLH